MRCQICSGRSSGCWRLNCRSNRIATLTLSIPGRPRRQQGPYETRDTVLQFGIRLEEVTVFSGQLYGEPNDIFANVPWKWRFEVTSFPFPRTGAGMAPFGLLRFDLGVQFGESHITAVLFGWCGCCATTLRVWRRRGGSVTAFRNGLVHRDAGIGSVLKFGPRSSTDDFSR